MFVLVTGGSGSGKSEYAEMRVMDLGNPNRYYIATMMCFDDESRRRVQRHRMLRAGKGFETIECFLNIKDLELPEWGGGSSAVLLECMSNLTANEMFDPAGSGEKTGVEIKTGIDRLLRKCDNLVVVTNEIFSDGMKYDLETETYQKVLGELNRYMAGIADEVVEVVYGIPVMMKKSRVGYPDAGGVE